MQFIVSAQPKLCASPPVGDGWIHEAKFDGWRIQLHKELPADASPPPMVMRYKVWRSNKEKTSSYSAARVQKPPTTPSSTSLV